MMVTFLRTRVVNGLRWIFSKEMSPSNFSERVLTTLSATKVCTCGIWIASAAANRKLAVATTIRQSIFINLFITLLLFVLQLAKIVKISEKIRIFAGAK